MIGCSKREGIIWYGNVDGQYGDKTDPLAIIYTLDEKNLFGIFIDEELTYLFEIVSEQGVHDSDLDVYKYELYVLEYKGQRVVGQDYSQGWSIWISKDEDEHYASLSSPENEVLDFNITKRKLP
ncbi:hypothetical protein [Maribacter sp. IgM3_T14_3]|uniref:hypothetical protein n=1 Tax=Maribacter sp. IgM3_T14_3 TaxID=3415140 RepID=UPI003C6FD75D